MGLGKPRSSYGAFLDRHKIKQEKIAELTGLNRDTISDICNNQSYKPRKSTANLLLIAAKRLTGKDYKISDFW